MMWTITLSYYLRTPANRGNRPQFHADVHRFETEREAEAFANRATVGTGWIPAGAYDAEISEPIYEHTRAVS